MRCCFFYVARHLFSPKNILCISRWHKYNWWCDVERQFQCKWATWEQEDFKRSCICNARQVALPSDVSMCWGILWQLNMLRFQAYCNVVKGSLTHISTNPFGQALVLWTYSVFWCIIDIETWKKHWNEPPHLTIL